MHPTWTRCSWGGAGIVSSLALFWGGSASSSDWETDGSDRREALASPNSRGKQSGWATTRSGRRRCTVGLLLAPGAGRGEHGAHKAGHVHHAGLDASAQGTPATPLPEPPDNSPVTSASCVSCPNKADSPPNSGFRRRPSFGPRSPPPIAPHLLPRIARPRTVPATRSGPGCLLRPMRVYSPISFPDSSRVDNLRRIHS